MFTDFLIEPFAEAPERTAIVSPAGRCSFGELGALCRHWAAELEREGVEPGTVVGLEGDFSPNSMALLFALTERAAIVVPQSNVSRRGREQQDEIAQVEAYFYVDREDRVRFERTGRKASHELYDELRRRGHPGFVGFSSGTSGEPKAAVHDFSALLEYFHKRRPAFSTLSFLLFEHLGGLRTAVHALSNAVTMVSTHDRSPETVCALIEEHRLELLPATPTFFNLMLLSGAHRRHDLSSLKVISYGAEPMPESTVVRLRAAFPDVRLQQTYGLIEIGALGSKSRDDGSLWMTVGGRGFETRVVDGILQIRSRAMTLGYLNAPAPFTPDGWFITGDAVLQDGEYLRVLGRDSELINVGGKKVFPAEVESVIQAMESVEDVTVYGEPNRLVGNIVCARVKPVEAIEDPAELVFEVKRVCREQLARFKVPVRVRITDERQFGSRYKKLRNAEMEQR